MITSNQVATQAVIGGATVHLLQIFNIPKSICPYISGTVAFLSGIGLTLTFSGDFTSGGSACFVFPAASLLTTSLLASIGQWIAQEGYYQNAAKPTPPSAPVPVALTVTRVDALSAPSIITGGTMSTMSTMSTMDTTNPEPALPNLNQPPTLIRP